MYTHCASCFIDCQDCRLLCLGKHRKLYGQVLVWSKSLKKVLLTCLRSLPLTRKELDMEGGRENGAFRVSSCCVYVQVCVNVCLYQRNCSTCACLDGLMNLCGCVLQTSWLWPYLWNSLSISVYISLSSFVWFAVCVPMCVYSMSAFLRTPYQLSTFIDSHTTEQPPPSSLFWFRYSLHLVFMKAGSKPSVTLLWPAFFLPTLSFPVTISLVGWQPGLI